MALERNETEKNRTKTLLMDLMSTLDELIVYLSPGHKIHDFITKTRKVLLTNNPLVIKTKEIKEKLKKDLVMAEDNNDEFFRKLRGFISSDLLLLVKLYDSFFHNLVRWNHEKVFFKEKWEDVDPLTLFGASYSLLTFTARSLRNLVNRYLDIGFVENVALKVVDDSDRIWDTSGMRYIEFASDINKIREYAQEIIDDSDFILKDEMLVRLQVSEFIKNAVRHGNKLDPKKKVKVWYNLNNDFIKLIIEDEGEGFRNLEEWNKFNVQRIHFIEKNDLKNLVQYASYRTEDATDNDGGNFLFSALEYWDSGVIFNTKKNKVYLMKYIY